MNKKRNGLTKLISIFRKADKNNAQNRLNALTSFRRRKTEKTIKNDKFEKINSSITLNLNRKNDYY